MSSRTPLKLGDVNALMQVAKKFKTQSTSGGVPHDDPAQLRRLLADFCRLLGTRAGKPSAPARPSLPVVVEFPPRPAIVIDPALPPRLRQTLTRLLNGDSEKQIAAHLGLSPHTVHAYVKSLHKHYGVSSRGELLARFIHHSQQQ